MCILKMKKQYYQKNIEKGVKMSKYKKTIISIIWVFAVLNIAMPLKIAKAVSRKTVNSAYNSFLSKQNRLWTSMETYTTDTNIKFRAEDLNADGIPELLIHNDKASNGDRQLAVYAHVNGKVKYISSYPLWSVTFYRNKSGLVYSEISRDSSSYGSYAVFNKKKMVMKYYWNSSYDYENMKDKKIYFNADKKEIFKDNFKNKLSKLEKNSNKLKISEGADNMYINNSKKQKKVSAVIQRKLKMCIKIMELNYI